MRGWALIRINTVFKALSFTYKLVYEMEIAEY